MVTLPGGGAAGASHSAYESLASGAYWGQADAATEEHGGHGGYEPGMGTVVMGPSISTCATLPFGGSNTEDGGLVQAMLLAAEQSLRASARDTTPLKCFGCADLYLQDYHYHYMD